MESPLLLEPGAVPADPPDVGVAAHYGDPMREQRTLAEDVGVVDRGNRGVVRVSGEDRLSWLHDLTTQNLRELRPHVGTDTLALTPQGRVQHHLALVDDGEAVWAHVEPGTAPTLQEYLQSMRFLLRVEPEDVTDAYAVVTILGPRAEEVIPADLLARRADHAVDLFVPRERLSDVVGAIRGRGAALAGLWAYEALRVESRRPRLGLDTDHRTIPHEVGWIGTAVHLNKGCYQGQETVARVHNLGRPPRRMVFLHLDGSVNRLPARGAAVELAGREVGFVGSSARHYELGPIGLAVVKQTTPTDVQLVVDGVAAAQEIVVEPQRGPRVQRPSVSANRERRRE